MMDISYLRQAPQISNPAQLIAQDIVNGGCNKEFTYCLESGYFYTYTDGYWKTLFNEEILRMIEVNYPGINKYSVTAKKQVLDQLKIKTFKRLAEFNCRDLLNFPNGMYDPLGDNIGKHNPELLSTLRLKYKYDKLAECPLWINTLKGIFENDQERIDMLQEFFGYCLTRDVTLEKSLLLLGESRSGKSTILDTLNHMMGESDNVSSVALCNLANPQYTSLLINKMVNIDWDVEGGAEKFEANFKIITSGEPVGVNEKYIKAFSFRPYCKLVLAANKFPRITDHSSAFYKRLILIPCNRVFEPSEQDQKLKIKLRDEMPGIFNWAVIGLQRLLKRTCFDVSRNFMIDALDELREESNPVDVFFKEVVEIDVSGTRQIYKDDLYKKYGEWCLTNGNGLLSKIRFNQSVYQKYGRYTPKNYQCSTGRRSWKNIRYKEIKTGEDLQWKESTN